MTFCKRTTLTLGMLLVSVMIQAQGKMNPQSDSIQWEYSTIDNVINREKISLQGNITSYGGRKFVWTQNGVDRKYIFETQSTEGSWVDVRDKGKLVYRVTCNGEEGTISLIKEKNDVTIVLNFEKTGKHTPHIVLQVSSYRKI